MPDHDLVALWEAHCRYEFETRDVDATMATMVAEPYVNNMPTMTGPSDVQAWLAERVRRSTSESAAGEGT
jgi:hypothetical protein